MINNNTIKNILINTNECKLINIIWIERGIKLAIINNILKLYNKLKKKRIIIHNYEYRIFATTMFPNLKFKSFDKSDIDNPKNYYFNIKHELIKRDVYIDYIKKYNYIYTDKINLIPWFDMNNPLILHKSMVFLLRGYYRFHILR